MGLVLKRSVGNRILVGDDIVVTVIETTGKFCRLLIDAPKDVSIDRPRVRESKVESGSYTSRRTDGEQQALRNLHQIDAGASITEVYTAKLPTAAKLWQHDIDVVVGIALADYPAK